MRSLSLVVSGVLVVACAIFIYRQDSWREIATILTRLDARWFAAAAVVYWLLLPLPSLRFQRITLWLMHPMPAIPLALMFKLTCSAAFVSVLAPVGGASEVTKVAALRALGRLSVLDAARCTLFDRVASAQCMALFGIAVLPAQYLTGMPLRLIGIELGIFAIVIAAVAVLLALPRTVNLFGGLIPLRLAALFEGYPLLLQPRRLAWQMVLAFLNLFVLWLTLELLLAAAGMTVNGWLLAGLVPFLLIVNSIPLLYLGWGGRELAMAATLGAVSGLSVNEALALSAALGGVMMITAAASGVFILGDWRAHRGAPASATRGDREALSSGQRGSARPRAFEHGESFGGPALEQRGASRQIGRQLSDTIAPERVEQDQRPAQRVEREIAAQAGDEIGIVPHGGDDPVDERVPVVGGQLHRGMQDEIGGDLHGIVPAEIFEVDVAQPCARLADDIVEAEVRRDQAPKPDRK